MSEAYKVAKLGGQVLDPQLVYWHTLGGAKAINQADLWILRASKWADFCLIDITSDDLGFEVWERSRSVEEKLFGLMFLLPDSKNKVVETHAAVSHVGEMPVVLELHRVLRLTGELSYVPVSMSWGGNVAIFIGCCRNHRNRQPSFTPRSARVRQWKILTRCAILAPCAAIVGFASRSIRFWHEFE